MVQGSCGSKLRTSWLQGVAILAYANTPHKVRASMHFFLLNR